MRGLQDVGKLVEVGRGHHVPSRAAGGQEGGEIGGGLALMDGRPGVEEEKSGEDQQRAGPGPEEAERPAGRRHCGRTGGGGGPGGLRLEQDGEGGQHGGGHAEDGKSGGLMPEAVDVPAGVCEQCEGEGAEKIHAEGQQGGHRDDQQAAHGAADLPAGEEKPGIDAGDQAANAAAGFLDAHAGGGQLDDVAMLTGRDAEQVQGFQDAARDPVLQPEGEAGVGSVRQWSDEQPEENRGQADPVERDDAQPFIGEDEQPGQQVTAERTGENQADQGVVPGEGGGKQPGQGEQGETQEKDPGEQDFRQGARRQPARSAVAAALPDQQKKYQRREKAVGQVGIMPPLGPEQHAESGGQAQQEGHQAEDIRGRAAGGRRGRGGGGRTHGAAGGWRSRMA